MAARSTSGKVRRPALGHQQIGRDMNAAFESNLRKLVRWVLGLLLVWAALSKLANPQEFYGHLLAYRLPLSDISLQLTAAILPWLELVCGLLLFANYCALPAMMWAQVLFIIFMAATGEAWLRGLKIDCGCFD